MSSSPTLTDIGYGASDDEHPSDDDDIYDCSDSNDDLDDTGDDVIVIGNDDLDDTGNDIVAVGNDVAATETKASEDDDTATSAATYPVINPSASVTDDDMDTAKRIVKKLWDSWFGRHFSTAHMKKGSKNESIVIKALKAQRWVLHVWDIGLVTMHEHPYIGVSADGIVEIRPPGQSETVYAALEVKTKTTAETIGKAITVRRYLGTDCTECNVGEEKWFKAVPWEYRAQVLHQATVFKLDRVLFVMATTTSLLYSVVVNVTAAQRAIYVQSLTRHGHLLMWAHDGGNVSTLICMPCRTMQQLVVL